ncbi:hypothetical protein CS063_03430 [Sporanaerobium hydrogeniformans]|uniref:Uncharacterized protein n=1 Tax=Sporanaerobium hydrogeniformans TaxID=3072179 RepID=A0AC61DF17_9FIRM|nr:hypothetical protein [Sporanaerobium hydrogeniformans]PHV71628.1 hypothetical protein CS063_03430 [Sporanaerobium hydrogeniformans]
MIEIILSSIIILCTFSILQVYPRAKRRYKACLEKQLIKSKQQLSEVEKIFMLGNAILLLLFSGMVCISIWTKTFNEALLLGVAVIYLGIYYMQEGLIQSEWVFYTEGLMGRRCNEPIEWQNILDYTFEERKGKDILKLRYKGKGLVIRRSVWQVTSYEKQVIQEILEKYVSVTL